MTARLDSTPARLAVWWRSHRLPLAFVIAAATCAQPSAAAQTQVIPCIGDCNANGVVTIDEIVIGVDMALRSTDAARCPAFACNAPESAVAVNCAVAAVDNALRGCDEAPASGDGACCLGTCTQEPNTCRPSSRDFCCLYSRLSAVPLAIWWCPPDQIDSQTYRCASCVAPCLDSATPTDTPPPPITSTPPPTDVYLPPFALSGVQDSCWSETGERLLAGVRSTYEGTLISRPETPWPRHVPFTVWLAYRGGSVTCYPPYVPPPGSTRPFMREHVGVVMQVQFTTANGAFAETVDAELRGGAYGGTLSFHRRPEDIEGAYRPNLPGYEDVLVGVWGNFFGDWSNGGVVQSGMLPGHASQLIPIAYWQPESGEPPPRALTSQSHVGDR